MFRIEYGVPVMSGRGFRKTVVLTHTREEASEICDKCDKLGYPIFDVSNHIEMQID